MEASSVVVLSGRVCAGKTTLATALASGRGWSIVSTRHVIERYARAKHRSELQKAGRALDERTRGRWVAEAVRSLGKPTGDPPGLVVDAVRTQEQIDALRETYPVVHVHLRAPLEVLAQRYGTKKTLAPDEELDSYALVAADPVEAGIDGLANSASLVLDAGSLSVGDLVSEVARTVVRDERI